MEELVGVIRDVLGMRSLTRKLEREISDKFGLSFCSRSSGEGS